MSDSITYPAVKYRKQRCVVTSLDSQKKRKCEKKTMSTESTFIANVSQGNISLLRKQDEMFVSMMKTKML